MWILAAPFGVVAISIFVYKYLIKTPKSEVVLDCEIGRCQEGEHVEEIVVADVIQWLRDAETRIVLTKGPEPHTVDSPTGPARYISFTARGQELEIWLGGPTYLSPFPRLKQAGDNGAGVRIYRSPDSIEKAILLI
jgi:hypothetical protein